MLNFQIEEEGGCIRDVNYVEELVRVVRDCKVPMEREFIDSILFKNECIFQSAQSLKHSIKCAGGEINIMTDHFINMAVYAYIIGQLIEFTRGKLKGTRFSKLKPK